MGQQVGRVGEPGAGLQHQPPQQPQQPRGLRGSSAARPAGRRREAAGRSAEGGFNVFTQHGERPGRGGKGRDRPSSPPSFVVVGLLGEGRGRRGERGSHVPGDARPGRHVPGDARLRRSFPPGRWSWGSGLPAGRSGSEGAPPGIGTCGLRSLSPRRFRVLVLFTKVKVTCALSDCLPRLL